MTPPGDLDLEEGDEERANQTPAERRRIAREMADEGKASRTTRKSKTSTSTRTSATAAKEDAEVTSRLARALDRVVKALEARGDEELASIIREDGDAIQQGIVSLTQNVKVLRRPLIFLLNLVEPALAFGRIGRVLFGRWNERAQRKNWERQQQQEGEIVEGVVVQ